MEKQDRFGEINSPEFLGKLLSRGPAMQAAYRTMVSATHQPLFAYIRRFVPSPEEAGEILQEVYLGVFKGLARFEGKSKLSTWIYGLAHHKICDRLSDRYRQHREWLESDEAPVPEPEAGQLLSATAWDLPPDQWLRQSALKALIARAVAALPPMAAEVYHLRDVEGLSGEEVAKVLGTSDAAVRVRLHRARNLIVDMVRAQLRGEGAPAPRGGAPADAAREAP